MLDFKNIFEGKEVERFLQEFVNPQYSDMPKRLEEVLADVKAIWQEKGFITPAELKSELLVKYSGESAHPLLTETINNIELSRNLGEKVTGYLGREHTYLATGLAHLYSKIIDNPMAMIEIDFSNMGGTNLYFKELLAKELNIDIEEVKDFKAEALTDKAALLIANKLISVVKRNIPDGEKIVPIRSGGDELRVFFTGVKSSTQLRALNDKLHSSIEGVTAKLGLHGHKHLKAPDNPLRNGFGAALTIKDMSSITDPENLIHELDAKIKAWKYIIGALRQGELDEEFAKKEVKHLIDDGVVSAGNISEEDFILVEVQKLKSRVSGFAKILRSIQPKKNLSTEDLETYVEKSLARLDSQVIKGEYLKPELDVEELTIEELFDIPPMLAVKERREIIANKFLYNEGVEITEEQQYLLNIALKDLAPKDPSSGAILPKEIITAIKSYKEDIADFGALVGNKEYADPYMMGVSFHGLAAMNDVFGHHVADVFLKYLVKDVIKGSVAETNIGEQAAEDASYVAHHGGGNFSVLLKPIDMGYERPIISFSDKKLLDISEKIEKKIEHINKVRVDEFFLSQGVRLDKEFLKEKGIKYFSDLEDTKEREIFFGTKVFNKKVNGIHAVTSRGKIAEDERRSPARILGMVRDKTDEKLEILRSYIALKEEMQHSKHIKKLSNHFKV